MKGIITIISLSGVDIEHVNGSNSSIIVARAPTRLPPSHFGIVSRIYRENNIITKAPVTLLRVVYLIHNVDNIS